MTPQDHEQEGFKAASEGRWNDLLTHGKQIPLRNNFFDRLPSQHELPDDVINNILDHYQHRDKNNKDLPNFLFELSHNLPKNANKETLNRIADLGKEDWTITQNVHAHPNFSLNDKNQSLKHAADFWGKNGYESKVQPHHFATVAAMLSGKGEEVKTHRGLGQSKDEVVPHLKNHAQEVEKQILNDEFIPKRYFNNKPYVRLFRGVGGNYGQAIHKKVNYNPATNEADDKEFHIPTASMSSWTTDPQMAGSFAHLRGNIDSNQPTKYGVVISKWHPVDAILHSGHHTTVTGQEHPHMHENEIVIGHPTGKEKISTKNMTFQHPDDPHAATTVPTLRPKNINKSEHIETLDIDPHYDTMLHKSMKNNVINAVTAMSMLGASIPMGSVDSLKEKPATALKAQSIKPHPALRGVAWAESSNKDNPEHQMVTHGVNKGQTAIGRYGLMPGQVIDTLQYDKHLGTKYPEVLKLHPVKDQAAIKARLLNDDDFHTSVVNSHWNRLGKNFNNVLPKMVYAWNRGITAGHRATDEEIKNDPYTNKVTKHLKLLELEEKKNKPLGKSEESETSKPLDNSSIVGVTDFQPDKRSMADGSGFEVQKLVRDGKIHPLDQVGHFTHASFMAGFNKDNSWLLKLEPTNRPGIKSAKHGLQSVREVAFSEIADKVFGLGEFTPKAVFGFTIKNGEEVPTGAIKFYPEVYRPLSDREEEVKGTAVKMTEPYLKSGLLHKMSALMYILGDLDGHGKNVLSSDNGHLKWIDHGSSFASDEALAGPDKAAFIPYCLRRNIVKDTDASAEKLEKMPRIKDIDVKRNLSSYLHHLDQHLLKHLVEKYGLPSEPVLKRLKILLDQCNVMDPDMAINTLWVRITG